jgi:hypothetical protein
MSKIESKSVGRSYVVDNDLIVVRAGLNHGRTKVRNDFEQRVTIAGDNRRRFFLVRHNHQLRNATDRRFKLIAGDSFRRLAEPID